MTLPTFWFIVIAVLWTGFIVLEGFDFGVGMLHGVVGRDETGGAVAINTIGPFWDGNEVWLIVGAARPCSPRSPAGTPPCSPPATSPWCCCWWR